MSEHNLTPLEICLQQDPRVIEFKMIVQSSPLQENSLLAYVVLAEGSSLEDIQSFVRQTLPDHLIPHNWVSLWMLPQTPDGDVDIEALQQLPVLDETLVQAWDKALSEHIGRTELAVSIQPVNELLSYRHVTDVLTGFSIIKHTPTTSRQLEASHTPTTQSATLSLLEGQSLVLPEDLPDTLPAILRKRSADAQNAQLVFVSESGQECRQSYQQLLADAEIILSGLRLKGVKPQDKVIVQLRHNTDVLTAFWGCVLGGFIPVIMAPPPSYSEANNELERLIHVYQHLQQPFILGDTAQRDNIAYLERWCAVDNKRFLILEDLRQGAPDTQHHVGQADEIALLTLTSGSTGVSKCIPLTHGNLISRAVGANRANDHQPEDVILNWLPFDHIGSISDWHIRCVILGCTMVYAPKEYVLSHLLNWLALIDQYRITHSWAPNFAYSLILNALAESDKQADWDLSCVKGLLTAGEAVSPATVAAFLAELSCFGFSAHAICPAFGMAEMGSGVTYFKASPEHPLRFHNISRASMDNALGVIPVADTSSDSVSFTSLGGPIPGVSLRIVDEQCQLVPTGTVGQFQVKGAAVASGYYQNPQATSQAFLEDGWFDTGDLAFFLDDELIISGRAKDVIIINGANFANAEIEAVIDKVSGVTPSFTAACAVRMPDTVTEELAIFFCPIEKNGTRLAIILQEIQKNLLKTLGLKATYLIPLEAEAIPKTAIGKIQRKQLAQKLEAGNFNSVLKQVDMLLGNARTVPDWFYRRIWQRKNAVAKAMPSVTGLHVIITDTQGLATDLQRQLELMGNTCLCLPLTSLPTAAQLKPTDMPLVHIWHLAAYTPYIGEIENTALLESSQEQSMLSLITLVQTLRHSFSSHESDKQQIMLSVVTSYAQAVTTDEAATLAYEKSPVPALLKSIAVELPWLACRHIDLPLGDSHQNVTSLLNESTSVGKDIEVAWRDGSRYVSRLHKIELSSIVRNSVPLKTGFYLLIGGLGGIGFEVASFLLQQYAAKLLVIGLTDLSHKEAVTEPKIAERLATLQQLQTKAKSFKGEVQYLALDAGDAVALEQAVLQAEDQWQTKLSGVFHLAGVAHEKTVLEESRDSFFTLLRPKLRVALAIRPLLIQRPEVIVVYSSSAAGFFGGARIGAYAAANAFLDALATYQQYQGLRSYSLAWSMWDEIGLSRGTNVKDIFDLKGYCLINPQQALYSLLMGLVQESPSVLIGLDGGKAHIRHYRIDVPANAQQCVIFHTPSVTMDSTTLKTLPIVNLSEIAHQCRFEIVDAIPRLANGSLDVDALVRLTQKNSSQTSYYLAPRSALEIQLTAIWQAVLKKTKIGILDNFFALGGASLQVIQCIARINQALGVELLPGLLFKQPTIETLAAYIAAQSYEGLVQRAIPHRLDKNLLEVSFAQQRLWFLDELDAGEAYNIPVAIRLNGIFDVPAFQEAFTMVIQRHEVLRSCFPLGALKPVLKIEPNTTVSIVDLTALPLALREAAALEQARDDALRPFNLSTDVLLRATILRVDINQSILLLNLHHIAGDGWSISVLAQELRELYATFLAKQAPNLPNLPLQYGDFAIWQRQTLQGERLEKLLAYWKHQLSGAPELLPVPTDFPRPGVETYQGGQQNVHIAQSVTDALKQIGTKADATLYMTLLAAFNVLLYRYTGQDDLVIGSPVACRNRPELEPLIGFFANTLPLRTQIDPQANFYKLLVQVRETAQAAYDHQDVPFEKLVEELQLPRTLAYNPLVQVLFALQNVSAHEFTFDGVACYPLELPGERALFDLELQLWETPRGLEGFFRYKKALFQDETIARMAGHLDVLLQGIVANPDADIHSLPLLTPADQQQLMAWNATDTDYPKDKTIVHLFEAQVQRSPDQVAVVFEDQSLTYAELNSRANQVAHCLIELGVQADTLVGICVERSLEMVIGLLGILKAGGAYVPLDPTYPMERLRYMLSDCGAKLLLSQSSLQDKLALLITEERQSSEGKQLDGQSLELLYLDIIDFSLYPANNLTPLAQPNDLAYVIYTSGSTGRPKGVMIENSCVMAFLTAFEQMAPLSVPIMGMTVSPFGFDVFVWECFSTLCFGHGLHIVTMDTLLEPQRLVAYLQKYDIAQAYIPPSLLEPVVTLFEMKALIPLKRLLVGVEAISESLLQRFRILSNDLRIINGYGPTETTVCATFYDFKTAVLLTRNTPIGRPLANYRVYLLGDNTQPMPLGIPGELCLAGAGLARGYLNRPDLTAEKFIEVDLFGQRERIYRTGDLARWLPDGNLEFLGRIDHQVKLRGFRIELGEIEAVLSQHESVSATVVIVYEREGNKSLAAYVTLKEGQSTNMDFRTWLTDKLPEYMIPASFTVMEQLPLTPNSKINRKVLPAPDLTITDQDGQPLRTETEQLLASLWSSVLKIDITTAAANFFTLGGHSLLATQLASRIRDSFGVNMPLRTIFAEPVLTHMATWLDRQQRGFLYTIETRPAEIAPVLSFAQQRLWFLTHLEGPSATYNIPMAVRLTGQLDIEALRDTFIALVQRHESLRQCFPTVNGEASVQLLPVYDPLILTNLSHLPADIQQHQVQQLAENHANMPFNLAEGPLLRLELVLLNPEQQVLLLNMHHIISDGWSIGILVREWGILYHAFQQGQAPDLAPLLIQYSDYAVWQRQWLQGDVQQSQQDYWTQQLADVPTLLELPIDFPRPAVQNYQGASLTTVLDNDLKQHLYHLGQTQGCTLYMTLLGAFNVLLHRYTGQHDICVGSPIANRHHGQTEGLIGFFVNTLVLRTHLQDTMSFSTLLKQVRQTALGAYAHQDLPFEHVVELLKPQRSLSHSPLFQVMLVLQNNDRIALDLPNLQLKPLERTSHIAKFDLLLNVEETVDGLVCTWEYATGLFREDTIARMAGNLEVLLQGIVANPDADIHSLPLLTPADQQQLMAWNATDTDYPKDKTIVDLFEAQVETTPDNIAVVFEEQSLTYAELNSRANQVAHCLIELGVQADTLVGICVERSLEMVIGLLGILKAGGAYMPLDPSYPQERLRFMLEDSQVKVLLTKNRNTLSLTELPYQLSIVDLDTIEASHAHSLENPARPSGPNDLAYVIYTSGSTGKPKGVMIEHHNLCNLIRWHQQAFNVTLEDRASQFANSAFDAATWEIWPYLCTGASLHLIPSDLQHLPVEINDWLEKKKITIAFLPTPLAESVLAFGFLKNTWLRLMLTGGDQLKLYPQALLPFQVINNYGPTENTIVTTSGSVKQYLSGDIPETLPNIGIPIANTRTYILDTHQQLLPAGIPGELCIAGAGLARGYLNRPDLTAEKFIEVELLGQRERIYRTGDLARWLPDGNLEFLGRIDHQVKLRGFRIELGEIEAVLSQHESVSAAVVIVYERQGNKLLAAYVTLKEGQSSNVDLRTWLITRLPEYMIPASFTFMEQLPLTPNGKINRKALPAPDVANSVTFEAPSSEIEQQVAVIWQALLGLKQVSRLDNFFELGGHSLLATQVVSRIRQTFHIDIALKQLFAHRTLAELASYIDSLLRIQAITWNDQEQTEDDEVGIL